MKKRIIFVLVSIPFVLWNCTDKIDGSGNVVTNTYEFLSINEIDIKADFDFEIIPATDPLVSVTTDDNLIPHIVVSETNGKLRITYDIKDKRLKPTNGISVLIETPAVNKIKTDYDAHLYISDFSLDYLYVENLDADVVGDNLFIDELDIDNYEAGMVSLFGLDNEVITAHNLGYGFIELDGIGNTGDYINDGLGSIYADYYNLIDCKVVVGSAGNVSVDVIRSGILYVDFESGSTGWVYSAGTIDRVTLSGSGEGDYLPYIPVEFKDSNPDYYLKKRK